MTDERLAQIIENVLHETSPKSYRAVVFVQQSKHASLATSRALTLDQIYTETNAGQRFFDETMASQGERSSHRAYFCDGTRCASVEYDKNSPETQKILAIGHEFRHEARTGFRDVPQPFIYYHAGQTPLHEALPNAQRLEPATVMGRLCDVFHVRDVGRSNAKQSLVYSLDTKTSIPLRVAAYSSPERIGENAPNWVWEASSIDEVAGRHVARKSQFTAYPRVKGGESGDGLAPEVTRTIEVREIAFDASYPRSTFWPKADPEAVVLDSIAKKATIPSAARSTSSEPANPIRVTSSDFTLWLAGAGVGLSLAILAVALLLRRRAA